MESQSARLTGPAFAAAAVGAAVFWFATKTGFVDERYAKYALVAAAAMLLVHLVMTVDPAWLLTAGVLSTVFAGNWNLLHLGGALGPHRVLLAAGIGSLLFRAPPARDRPPIHLGVVHLAMAAALAYAIASAYISGSITDSDAQFVLIDQFGLLPFVMFTVAPVAFRTERQRTILLGGLVATGGYLAVTALMEKLKLYGLLVPQYIGDPNVGYHFGRARGPFVEAAADGLALYCCTVAAAIGFVKWKRPDARAGAAFVALLAPVGVLLTVTRGVWVAAIVATLVAVAVTPLLRRLLIPIAVAGAITVLVAFAAIPGLAGDAHRRQDDKPPVYERDNTNAAGLRMVQAKPFFGFGFDRANANLLPYFRLRSDIPLTGEVAGLHNIYLSYAVGLGLIGAGLWLLAVALAFGRAITVRETPPLVPWQIGLVAVVVAWAIVGVFSPAHYAFTTYLVWTWAGVASAVPEAVPIVAPRRLRAEPALAERYAHAQAS
jgi:putative inorganic carbon (HCO3(-)) transporter